MELLCTWKDVVDLIPQLWDSETGAFIKLKSRQDILAGIITADNQIRAELRDYYTSFSATTPWYKPPVADRSNHNDKAVLLPRLILGTDLKTEVITLTFNNASSYSLLGDFSGDLGTGSKYSTFTCSTLTIPVSAWYGNHEVGDTIYIRTYVSDPLLCDAACAPLAASNVLDSIYTDQVPNSVDTSNKYRQMAGAFIKRVRAGDAGLQNNRVEVNLTPEKVPYDIDDYGEDVTTYQS